MLTLFFALSTASAVHLEVLIPWYVYPNDWSVDPADPYLWPEMAEEAEGYPVTAVVNPDNGPHMSGTTINALPNTNYMTGMQNLASYGVQSIGYVPTGYGCASYDAVMLDIATYALPEWQYTEYTLPVAIVEHNLHGIFFDEVSTNPADRWCYEEYRAAALATGSLTRVVMNHGVGPDPSYLGPPTADSSVVFEGHVQDWLTWSGSVPAGTPPEQITALVYGSGSVDEMRASVDLAVERGFGGIYVTDDVLPNPWDTKPTHWVEQLEWVQRWNDGPAAVSCDAFRPGQPVVCAAGPVAGGTRVHFAAGRAGTSCLAPLAECLDLVPVNYLGSSVATTEGTATLQFRVPPIAPVGMVARVQAAHLGADAAVHPFYEGVVMP